MNLETLYTVFNSISPIPIDEWEIVSAHFKTKKFKKSETILNVGDSPEQFSFVNKGLTRLFYRDSEGKEFTKSFVKEGELAGAYAEMLMGIPSRLIIEAMEDTEVCVIDYREIVKAYDRNVCWQIVGRKMCEKYFVIKENRVFELLQLKAGERYDIFLQEYQDIVDRIPQYIIASYLGITPVSLSRLINKSGE